MKQNNNWKERRQPGLNMNLGIIPPQNKGAEKALIGQILTGTSLFTEVLEILPSGDYFYDPNHQKVYDAAISVLAEGGAIDLTTVSTQLMKRNELEMVGGNYHLAQLSMASMFDRTILTNAYEILDCYKRRESIRIAGELMTKAYDRQENLSEYVHEAEQGLLSVITEGDTSESTHLKELVIEFNEDLHAAMNSTGELTGVDTGFGYMNTLTNGWQKSDLIILAARPSVGKTALALNLAMNAAASRQVTPVGIFSLEMSKKQLMKRIVSAVAQIDLEKIIKGTVSGIEKDHIGATMDRVINMPIHIDDTFGVSITQFRARAKRMKRKYGIGMIIIDYLQLMAGETKGSNREQEIAKISRGLKGVAKELDIPIIALSQLSRAIENRAGEAKEPQLSDLRESGAIEQDADLVMFIYHPKDPNTGEVKNVVIVAKHRNGKLGKMDQAKFFPAIQKWMNPAEAGAFEGTAPYKPYAGITPPADSRIEPKSSFKAYDIEDAPF